MSDQFDLNGLLNQAMQMQQQLMEAQAQAAEAEVVGRAGGGAVEITVTGSMQFLDVSIRPDAVDPDDVGLLEDLVLAALHDAVGQIESMQRSQLGGFDLGALGDVGGLGGLGDLGGFAATDDGAGDPPVPPAYGGVLDTTASEAPSTDTERPDDERP